MNRIEIRNAKHYQTGEVVSLYIENGVLKDQLSGEADKVIDATGLTVMPGLVDMHCHLREPGFEYREDIKTGTASAAKGGFTSVCCMPNTKPVCDNAAVVEGILRKAELVGSCNVFPIGAASKGLEGKEIAEMGLMKEAGIVAVSDDGKPIATSNLLKKVLEYASDFDIPVLNHCEDLSIAEGAMNEGAISTSLGLRGIPAIAEEIMISRDVQTAEYLDMPIHICHVSTARGIDIIRQAKKRGVKVTCETCPHYFSLTEEACVNYDTNYKMNPPLRTEKDRMAVIEGLKDGTIDCIVTDHAPHHIDEKDIEFSLANNGIIGFETALAVGYTYLVKPGYLTLPELVEKMTVNPSKILKLGRGTLDQGMPADVTLADLNTSFVYTKEEILSKATNSPYIGETLDGRVKLTIVGGRITYDELC
ncbi:MAG: dihydroorotase [Clostridiales bacterium]|nr:dihydroorotase [Candidatus Scatonaster coprocaballi]